MNSKTLAITAVLAAALLTGIFTTSTMAAYAERENDEDYDDEEHDDEEREHDGDKYKGGGDESETNTEQEIKQKNVGSGESTNNNCALNSIDATGTGQGGAEVDCPVVSGDSRGAILTVPTFP
jgi:uncharacterized protein YdaT